MTSLAGQILYAEDDADTRDLVSYFIGHSRQALISIPSLIFLIWRRGVVKFMQRPLPMEYPASYQKYFDLVGEGNYLDLLGQNSTEIIRVFENIPDSRLGFRYAEGKWTVKELLMHVIDTERVFSYRGLAAARGDASPHYRMDEELYAGNVDVSHRTLQSLISEFEAVRSSTQTLFENISDDQSRLACNMVTYQMTARAIAYFIIGHAQHHLQILEERYLSAV